ncbi:hypothetical protein HYW75_03215 [Candidatus Pacearchaeota archaeon]|nr:hypothetical protein [Candidatus Pacearchaeota archaeon]
MKKSKPIEKELKKHIGEWVAICNKKIVACGSNPSSVMDKAKDLCGNRETTILRVPEKSQILLL